MNSPKVSIIVPCYNQAHFLNDSLQSVLNQIFDAWECIIVNDGSPDNTEEVAQKWCAKDVRFKHIKKTNGGLSSARNAGIAISRGDFILPLDADDLIHQDYLQKLLPVIENNDAIEVVSCYSIFFRDTIDNVVNTRKPNGTTIDALLYENIIMATSLYRKESWNRVGGYDESMKDGFEDWDFWISILKDGAEFKIVPEFLFYYRKAAASMLTNTVANHLESVTKYIYKKHPEVYINKFDTTMDYVFYLIKKHKASEDNLKKSLEYRIGKAVTKPFRFIAKLNKSKNK
ncbi:glycosyl transferase family 2 [Dokdonia sp. MED134]|uniref:glycosyltransferase family 2 protein n=1 Tax=Dokdonia sp. MED134 TaxID=313590 RepID=UPI000068B170|nr:glycosyltransferase family A protein [Dokdonia sp. MED134]EAQ37797.1 glycosyl transferase family 2 [Dokdonia sp. MED134]